jgi:hypothetical protein
VAPFKFQGFKVQGYETHHQVIHELMLACRIWKLIFVMPAWIAGIQFRKDASGNIHVDLDSSTPFWNDAIGALHKRTAAFRRLFSKNALSTRTKSLDQRLSEHRYSALCSEISFFDPMVTPS